MIPRGSFYLLCKTQAAEGKLPKDSHVFLGMTPRIYEELGFQRLPMAMTKIHLYSTLRDEGEIKGVNYHDLGEDILRQLPEQLKKPLCIVQSPNDETEIISVIGLSDKNGKTIIVPVAQYTKGNFNGAEIDINLVKTVFGKGGVERWLEDAIDDKRLLFLNKKETEPALDGPRLSSWGRTPGISTLSRPFHPASLAHKASLLQDVFGFLPENIAHYREAVKRKFPERFTAAGERILYKDDDSQLFLDFAHPPEAGTSLKSVLENIDQQRTERNSQLSATTKEYLSLLEKIDDIEKLGRYIDSGKNSLKAVKNVHLKVIKSQYDYEKSVEMGDTVLHSTDIPDRASPQDIKELLIYNAQYIVEATSNRINDLKFETGLFNPGNIQDNKTFEIKSNPETENKKFNAFAKKAGYVQGVCECVAVVCSEQNTCKKLLFEMQVTKDMAKKFANPETYKTLEKGIFAPQQKLEQTHSRKL